MADMTGNIPSSGNLTGDIVYAGTLTGDIPGIRGLKGDKGDPGDTGNGIASAVLNSNYTLTLTFTDGTTYTTPSIRGAQGERGFTGVSISGIAMNSDYTLTITLSDGTTYTTPPIRGAQGIQGETGNGIASIRKTGTVGLVDTYTVTYTDGSTFTYNVTNGANGAGSVADVWQNGVSVLDGDTAKVTVPTKTSDLTNDSGYITTETDPTVSSWAKSPTKPTYTASEVGAAAASHTHDDRYYTEGEVDGLIADEYSASSTYAVGDYCVYNGQFCRCTTAIATAEAWNSAHWTAVNVAEELTDLKGDIPQNVSDLTNDLGFQTASQVASAVTEAKVLVIDIASFSSLPQTVSNSAITADHVVVNSVLGTPSAQTGDWTVTTGAGTLTVSGSISGSTTLTLYLAEKQ